MRIKRFTGSSLKDVLAKVKAELGSEVVLLSSRTLPAQEAKNGERVEVRVAVEGQASLEAGGGDWAPEPGLALGRIEEDLAHIRAMLAIASAKKTIPETIRANGRFRLLFERLLSAGVEESLALGLMENLLERLPARAQAGRIHQELVGLLKEVLVVARPPEEGPIRWALVGPTGVGKTTVLAKLAAHFALKEGRSVGLVTVDTYRLAAAEQLAAYARLMGLELTVAFNRQELKAALAHHRGKDVVLLDTAGRSQNHLLNMNELKMLLREIKGLSRWLVLSATTKDQDMSAATKRFMEVGLSGFIFTKLDETDRYGELLNQVLRFKLPVAYLAAGQRVPEDIEPASQERLLRLVLNKTAQRQGVA
jgi:flagellar biosynthesis protein FlhF